MKQHKRSDVARKFLIFWCLFIGFGAVLGSTCMLIKPDGSILGMQELLPFFQVLPFADVLFQNYILPGIALLIVNGISNLTAAFLLLRKRKSGIYLGGMFGVTLMLWICIQFVIFPMNILSTSYYIFGLLQAITGYTASVFTKQEQFTVNPADYPRVGTNPRELVVYFSRLGYTRKIAYETANASGASLYEIRSTEKTDGTAGFWWCGRYGMHGWEMPIVADIPELSGYDKVSICSPIWVFGLCGPVRAFCKQAAGQIKACDYILVHHMNHAFAGIAMEMDKLLNVKHDGFRSVCCRIGIMRDVKRNSVDSRANTPV